MSSGRSWSAERVKIKLEDSLENLHRLDEHLFKPLTFNESIAELEATIAVYDHPPRQRPTMPKCENCSGHVTAQYKRVFADNQGTLHAYPHCRSQTDRYDGAGAGLT